MEGLLTTAVVHSAANDTMHFTTTRYRMCTNWQLLVSTAPAVHYLTLEQEKQIP